MPKKRSILTAITTVLLTSLCPIYAQTNDKASLVDQATEANDSPLNLKPTTYESSAKLLQEQETEKQELLGLWEAALKNSAEVRSLCSKLIPSGNKEKTEAFTRALIKFFPETTYTGIGSMALTYKSIDRDYTGPNVSISQITNPSQFSAFSRFLEAHAESAKCTIPIEQQREMYKSLRGLCKEVVGHYRDYKIKHKQLITANLDFEDLKKMIADSKNLDAANAIEIDYTLKKLERDIDEIGRALKQFKQFLIEITDEDAVKKLTESMNAQLLKAVQDNKKDISQNKNNSEPHNEFSQLKALWEATLNNSPDINFIFQKMLPKDLTDKSRTFDLASATFFLLSPGRGFSDHLFSDPAYVIDSVPARKGSEFLTMIRNSKLSEAEGRMLQNMIRTTANQLVKTYYDYISAKSESSKLKARQELVNFAGDEAVDKLDEDIKVESM